MPDGSFRRMRAIRVRLTGLIHRLHLGCWLEDGPSQKADEGGCLQQSVLRRAFRNGRCVQSRLLVPHRLCIATEGARSGVATRSCLFSSARFPFALPSIRTLAIEAALEQSPFLSLSLPAPLCRGFGVCH
jgi:hypothetical protein